MRVGRSQARTGWRSLPSVLPMLVDRTEAGLSSRALAIHRWEFDYEYCAALRCIRWEECHSPSTMDSSSEGRNPSQNSNTLTWGFSSWHARGGCNEGVDGNGRWRKSKPCPDRSERAIWWWTSDDWGSAEAESQLIARCHRRSGRQVV